MELPVNVLIIIALGLIVLFAILSVFYPSWSNGIIAANSGTAKSAACQKLIDNDCLLKGTNTIAIESFDADRDGLTGTADQSGSSNWAWNPADCGAQNTRNDNLAALCTCYYQITTEAECKNLCGCSSITSP
jgi:hypothetical protein